MGVFAPLDERAGGFGMSAVVHGSAPDGLLDAFWSYETALMADDVAMLDTLFAPGPETLRGDASGLLVGHDAISRFRGGRGGAPGRRIVEVHVRPTGPDQALVVAITELLRGGRGQQTQLWQRFSDGWKVTAAHVAVAAPAFDTRIWRVVGDPLIRAFDDGPLAGESVAVKDLYAVAGQPVGAGNPTWLAGAPIESGHAWAVERMLAAGADLRGIARTDEFAYSLAGTNAHYGTPPNPRAPHRISGGSSSGSVAAVALGQASIGLGTDTGGSIRVPAAYQGVYGIRTSRGAVPTSGLMPLAPTFDTVGWFTRDAELLRRVGRELLPEASPRSTADVAVVPDLLDLAEPEVAAPVREFAAGLGAIEQDWDLTDLATWRAAFSTWQGFEGWRQHGWWLASRMDSLGVDVRARFETASRIDEEAAAHAREVVAGARDRIRTLVGDRVVVLPSAPTVAPRIGADLQPIREATLSLTLFAGIGGLPAVSIPLQTADGLPCGACLIAAPGRDLDLLDLAVTIGE